MAVKIIDPLDGLLLEILQAGHYAVFNLAQLFRYVSHSALPPS